MQLKLLNNIVNEIAGKQGCDTINLIYGKKDVNEFLIAKKLGLTINQIRNTIYKLVNYGLITFIRKKDKKKGWYTYFWTINVSNALEMLDKNLKKQIEELQSKLKSRTNKRFYICHNCHIEVSEETALTHDFSCQECGEIYKLNDNPKIIEDLKNEINRLVKYRESVLEEIKKFREEKQKKALRSLKKLTKKTKKGIKHKRESKKQKKARKSKIRYKREANRKKKRK